MTQNLRSVLKKFRTNVETQLEEQVMVKDFLRIIYNREQISSFSQLENNTIPSFAAIFLRQSGLKCDDDLASEEFLKYKNLKVLKFKPHIKLTIHSMKLSSDSNQIQSLDIWGTSVENLYYFELSVITSVDGYQKRKKRFRYDVKEINDHIIYEIDSQFIHQLNDKSEDLSITLLFTRKHINCKMFCKLFNNHKIPSNEINIKIKQLPLIGIKNWFNTDIKIKDEVSNQFIVSVELSVEFSDEPKRNVMFRKEKLNAHKKLIEKIYNRWQIIPSEMKAIIELNRQQCGVGKDESITIESDVKKEMIQLSEANKCRNNFIDLINKAPIPVSTQLSDLDSNDNNDYSSNNGYVPPVKDPKFQSISMFKTKILE